MSLLFRQLLAAGAIPTSIVVEPATASVELTETQQLTATVFDANGFPIPSAVVTWGSDDTDIATVDSDGLVTAVAVGICTVTGTHGVLTDTSVITVFEIDPHFANVILLIDGTQPSG